ncbi:MAG: hypothetical protein NC390_07575 [Fusobacterium sp.]|nr:hypothetical protein [Fusobacterium sp.]
MKNNFVTRSRIGFDKFTNALTIYPVKGITGNKNSNFYEFLTMGTIPYIAGSAMLMGVFNLANKHFSHFDKKKADVLGKKMALGVLFYGLAKNISKSFITTPVKHLTGVDTELPYAKVNYELPDSVDDTDVVSIEYHKVYESIEFPRFDLLYGDDKKGEARNKYYDKIAKKLGLGEDLNDSDQEVKPLIREIVVKTNMAKTMSSYLWAATAVGLAMQKPWEGFMDGASLKFWKKGVLDRTCTSFIHAAKDSAKLFYKGEGQGIKKHGGKIMLGLAALSTVAGVFNAVNYTKKPDSLNASDVIIPTEKYEVC